MLHLMAFFFFFCQFLSFFFFFFFSVNWILVNVLIFFFCQLDTCKCVVLFFMYICKCFLMPFMYVLFVKILSYVEEIKNIYLS